MSTTVAGIELTEPELLMLRTLAELCGLQNRQVRFAAVYDALGGMRGWPHYKASGHPDHAGMAETLNALISRELVSSESDGCHLLPLCDLLKEEGVIS